MKGLFIKDWRLMGRQLKIMLVFVLAFVGMFSFTMEEGMILIIGMLVAFMVSLIVIRFLMGYIKKHDFKVFGWYRIVLGGLVLLCGLTGVLA